MLNFLLKTAETYLYSQNKDLTLYAILLYHQQESNAQSDLIEKCLHSIMLLCYDEICTK